MQFEKLSAFMCHKYCINRSFLYVRHPMLRWLGVALKILVKNLHFKSGVTLVIK